MTGPSLQALQQVQYRMELPFSIQSPHYTYHCQQLLRIVPGKRLVFLGQASHSDNADKKVIIKLFVHPTKAKKHWLRECSGAQLLKQQHIPSPEILFQECTEAGIYILAFTYIEGQTLAQFWSAHSNEHAIEHSNHHQKTAQEQKKKQLIKLIPVLFQHHEADLCHQDLHYGNFLLGTDKQIYTLDGEEVKHSKSRLKISQRLDNLALFLAQTFDISQSFSFSLVDQYSHLCKINLTASDKQQFWQKIRYYQHQRIEHYLKKMLRECTEVMSQKHQINNSTSTTVQSDSLCRREFYKPALKSLLAEPELFFQENSPQLNSLYQPVFLKQGNTCTVISVIIDGERYVIKRYNPKSFMYKLLHLGRHSRARKSWLNAHLLNFIDISTPAPVALVETRGLTSLLKPTCSYFICKFQSGQTSWDYFCDKESEKTHMNKQDNKKDLAHLLLEALTKLTQLKITHGDLKGSNIIIAQHQVYLLDLDAMKQHKRHWTFNKQWHRDKKRFLKNWEKKSCYQYWLDYFHHSFEKFR